MRELSTIELGHVSAGFDDTAYIIGVGVGAVAMMGIAALTTQCCKTNGHYVLMTALLGYLGYIVGVPIAFS